MKKGNRTKKTKSKSKNRPSKSLKDPNSYFFTRKKQQIVPLVQGTTGWTNTSNGGIAKAMVYSLQELNDNTDFKNLFKYYRINAARVQIYFSTTQSDLDEVGNQSNHALICMTDINQNGSTSGLDTQNFLDSQTVKIRQCQNRGKPFEFYCKLKQANQIYASTVPPNTDYTLMKPKFVATIEDTTPHYGLKVLLERISGEVMTSNMSNSQYARIVTTYYIECRKVH